MLVADSYLGHRTDSATADRLDGADPHRVVLDDTDRRRSRVRTETEAGRDLGVVVADELADGDVLETADGDLVVVELAAVEALAVDLADADLEAATALEVGHALGNRHRDLAVRDDTALVPVADSRERTAATVADLLPDGVSTRFETVSPSTFDDATPEHAHGGSDHGHGVRTLGGEADE